MMLLHLISSSNKYTMSRLTFDWELFNIVFFQQNYGHGLEFRYNLCNWETKMVDFVVDAIYFSAKESITNLVFSTAETQGNSFLVNSRY